MSSRLGTPLPGITFAPLLCVSYWVNARVPTFLGIVEHGTLISPAGKVGPESGRNIALPWKPGRAGHSRSGVVIDRWLPGGKEGK